MGEPPGVRHVVRAAAHGPARPRVDDIEGQRRVHPDGGVQARWRLPRAVADAGHALAVGPGGAQRQPPPVAGHHVPPVDRAAREHLQPLDRRVDVAGRRPRLRLLPQDVPRLARGAQRQLDVAARDAADARVAELEVRVEPPGLEGEPRSAQVAEHRLEIAAHVVGQHELVVQPGPPAHRWPAVGLGPAPRDEAAQQELLGQAHPRVGGHLERPQLDQPLPPRRGLGREQLVDAELRAVGVPGDVDQQVPEHAVHQPRRALGAGAVDLLERDLQLGEAVRPRLVHPRGLARGPDEQPREQVRQRRMVDPVGDEAAQQAGPAQERRVGRRRPPQHDVVAAPGAAVPAVEHELLGPQPGRARRVVEGRRGRDQIVPRAGGVGVDLDDPRVGGDLDHREPGVGRRRVAFDGHRRIEGGRGVLDPGQQVHVVVDGGEGREEHVQASLSRLHDDRGAHHPVGRLADRRGPAAGARGRRGGPGVLVRRVAAGQDVARRCRR